MNCSLPGSFVHGKSSGKNYLLPRPPPGDLPNPGIKPRSASLQADSLPVEPQWKPEKNPEEPYLGNKGPGLQNSSYYTQKCQDLTCGQPFLQLGLTFPSDFTILQLMIAKEQYILTEWFLARKSNTENIGWDCEKKQIRSTSFVLRNPLSVPALWFLKPRTLKGGKLKFFHSCYFYFSRKTVILWE